MKDFEIVTLYSEDRVKGCVQLTREGRFEVISISLANPRKKLRFLEHCWNLIGHHASAAYMGEELELCEADILLSISQLGIPSQMDLCEAAIFKTGGQNPCTREGILMAHEAVFIRGKNTRHDKSS